MKNYILEVCADSVESALSAKAGGATRLELCANLVIGGTTPGYELFEQVKKETGLPIRVLIRPRFGDFLYSEYEYQQMLCDVCHFAEAGADAIIGGHTHCLQGISYVEDVPVIYSLGNFWFGSTPTDGVNKKDTAIAQVIIRADGGLGFRFIPCVQENRQTYLVTDEQEKARIIAFEQQLSNGISIDADGYVTNNN